MTAPQTTFTCPLCTATSHNPNDAREGYCGRCHAFTGELRGATSLEHPLVLWIGPMTATIGTIGPCEDPRAQLVTELRRVAENLARDASDPDEAGPAVEAPPTSP